MQFFEHSQCHKLIYVRKKGLVAVEDTKKDLLKLRAKMDKDPIINNICLHHQYLLDTGYSNRQKRCLDPLKNHQKLVTKGLKIVTEDAVLRNPLMKDYLVAGDKLCLSCFLKLSKSIDKPVETDEKMDEQIKSSSSSVNSSFEEIVQKDISLTLSSLVVRPHLRAN